MQVAESLDVPVSFFFGATDGDAQDTRAILGFLDTAYSLRLLRAFSRVPEARLQRAIVELVESMTPRGIRSRIAERSAARLTRF